MSSKRELREQIALMRGDVEAWRDTVVRFAASRDAATRERDAVFAELTATRKQRDAAVDAQYQDREELMEARARVTELEAAILDHATTEPDPTPEPRPFRVGDRVRVAEGATCKGWGEKTRKSMVAGAAHGEVVSIAPDGDLAVVGTLWDYVSPEFCTLIEPAVEEVVESPTCPAAANLQCEHIACDATVPHQVHGSRSAGLIWSGPAGEESESWVDPQRWDRAVTTPQPVTLTLPDGTSVTFDAVVTR